MIGQPVNGQPVNGQPGRASGWRDARREVAVAAGLVAALAAAGYALDGAAAAGLVVIIAAAASIVVLRWLVRPDEEPSGPAEPYQVDPVQSFVGFWRTRADLADASRTLTAWEYGPRRRLQNLLAARLAERHGISLAGDPEAARRLLLGAGRYAGRHDLWYWIDPQRPIPADAESRPGIPPNVLAALIDRLEQL